MRQINNDSLVTNRDSPYENNDLPSIFAFQRDENPWRIDWFGELAFPNRLLRRKQPSLLIYLSRVIDDRYREDPSVLLSPDSTMPARRQRKVWLSVGTLPLLRIGDIWRDGKLDSRPDYQLETFSDVQIDKSTTSLVKAGLNLDDKGFLLPIHEHPWHLQCTHSYCVMVDLPDGNRLIVPCVELIRFYFGSSSNLVTKLFLPPLERAALYGNAEYNKSPGLLTLTLANGISGASAADIGRLSLDQIAWRAASHVGASALAASVAKQPIHVQTFFPFEGKARLVAAGKWLSLGDTPQATFIVYSLRSCSHPFPFQSLRYKAKDKGSSASNADGDGAGGAIGNPRKSAKDAKEQCLVDKDASSSLAHKTKSVWFEPRFPDLKKKAIWKEQPEFESAGDAPSVGVVALKPVQEVAVGDGGPGRRVRSIDLEVLWNSEDRKPVPEFLQATVEELRKLKEVSITLLTESEEDGWTVPVPALANEDGEIDPRLYVWEGERPIRLRRASVFDIGCNQERANLVLIESSPIYINRYLANVFSAEKLGELLRCATDDYVRQHGKNNANIAELFK